MSICAPGEAHKYERRWEEEGGVYLEESERREREKAEEGEGRRWSCEKSKYLAVADKEYQTHTYLTRERLFKRNERYALLISWNFDVVL